MTGTKQVAILLAFGAIYLIWGSTFLAIRYAIETLPPFFMMGFRSLAAGALLYGGARLTGAPRPEPAQWLTATWIGGLLFLGGHGALGWGELRVPSGIAALLMATIPVWMTLLGALRGDPITRRVGFGLALGFAGVILLAEPGELFGSEPVDLLGAVVLLLGALAWSIGSVAARDAPLPRSASLAAGMSLLAGGALLLAASWLGGERVDPSEMSQRSLLALVYLITLGSVVAFAAYQWLLRVSSPARVATYGFVNPAVAVFLGWSMGGESLDARIVTAMTLMILGVAAVVTGRSSPAPASRREPESPISMVCTSSIHLKEET